ncbi:H/ACA snoRNP pseudouridylase subunit [Ptychographa xylographoides]|nr:H/ACA snoRNP pseudouridylase subunit [Ptychographa xylographoides]
MAPTSFKLNTGASIPAVGLGTWQSAPGAVADAVYHALQSGYRHIDCAYCYQNEAEVGAGLARAFRAGVCTREEVFITTKLWCTFHRKVAENLDLSLKSLGLTYVDLYLMHCMYVSILVGLRLRGIRGEHGEKGRGLGNAFTRSF